MNLFRGYLVLVWCVLTVYTVTVGLEHGWNLVPIFLEDMTRMTWSGQFNFDFMTFLALSGLWVAWRHEFSLLGCLLGVVAFFGGMMFLALYVLWASYKAQGNVKILLLGMGRRSW